MKNKQELAQALSENLDRVDESLLQQAFETDTAEKFHALDGKLKRMHFPKKRPVTTFHRVASIAACLAVALAIAFGGIALAKHLSGSFGPGPTNPPPMTQPSGTTQIPDGSQLPHINLIHNQDKTLLQPFNYNWTYLDNGFSVTTNSDICHPLLSVDPLHLTYETTPVHLFLDVAPQQISVRCWDIKHQGKEDSFAQYEEIAVTKDYGHSYDFQLKPGSYIYEISLEWSDFHGSYGNVSYVFVATVANDGPASRDVTVSSGESTITTLPEFFCYGHHCIGNSMVYGDGIGAMGKLNLSGNETDISTIPVLPLDQEISIQLAEHGTLQWVEVFSQNADGKYVLLEDFAGTVEALSELPLGTWFVALNIEWKDTCIHDDSEERCYDHLFILEVSRQAEISNPHGTCGENATWEFDPATGKLTISGAGTMPDYHWKNPAPWYEHRDNIHALIIEDGITTIGAYAFYNLDALTSVTIGSGVHTIGKYAFSQSDNLVDITIPQNVDVFDTGVFYFCENLRSITLPDNMTSIGGYTFNNCANLVSITLPEGITTLEHALFYRCSNLTQVFLPDTLTTITGAFEYCTSLQTIVVPNNVTTIDFYAFQSCTGLTSISLPASLTTLGDGVFSGCNALTEITIPDGVTTLPYRLFYECSSLFSVTLPNGIKAINGWAFFGCTSLTDFNVPTELTHIGEHAFQYCGKLTSFPIPDSVTYIGEYAFRSCTGLTEITVPEGIVTIGEGTFVGCENLTSITLPSTLTSIGYMAFSSCYSLSHVSIPEGVTQWGSYALSDCTALTDITIPNGTTSISYGAFSGCTSLISITIPDSITAIEDYAFHNCHSLASITIPEGVSSIGQAAFYCCYSLPSITIPDSVTSIGNNAFTGCDNLTTVTLSSNLAALGDEAFSACYNLKSIYFTGDLPEFGEHVFFIYTFTLFYPADNDTWTEEGIDKLIEYYGNRIQFIAVDENGDPVDP